MSMWDLWNSVDWGKLLISGLPPEPQTEQLRPLGEPPRATQDAAQEPKPGCEAAEACVYAYGTLLTLADGMGGFGVLGLWKERLEKGAEAAQEFGSPQVAEQMRDVARKLPGVRTPEAAAQLAEEMKPVRDRAWRLGRACGLTKR